MVNFLNFQIYDGYDSESPLLLDAPCGYILPSSLTTASNYVYVMATFNAQLGSKFKLKWEAQSPDTSAIAMNKCNSSTIILRNDTVRLTSPGYPGGYEPNLNCSWIIKTDDPTTHAVFSPVVIDLEETANCLADYVTVFTSSDLVNWEKNMTLCNDVNRKIIHGTPHLMVQFYADHFINKTGFMGSLFKMCGGMLTDSSGTIRMSGSNYRMMNSQCDWRIRVRNGRKIAFTFEEFELPNTDGSCSNFVSLKNGPDEFSPILGNGTYCGPGMPQNINTTFSNTAFIRFSVRMFANVKFTLRYEEVAMECGDEIVLSASRNSTIIHTPKYPNVPDAHSECTWNIWSKGGESLKIEFIDRFDLTISTDCQSEYVELRSGTTQYSNVLGRLCGKRPDDMHTPGSTLQLKYFSDIPYPKNGFKARISLSGCDRIFGGNSGLVVSPLELHVSPNTVCEYTIIVSPAYKMNLTFTDTCSDENYDCGQEKLFEVVSVYSSIHGNETRISMGNYSQENFPTDMFIESNKAAIRFNASAISNRWFQLKFSFRAQFNNCGGTLTALSGEISSPGYPSARYRQKFCNWVVSVPKGRRIKVEILDLDLSNQTLPSLHKLNFYNDIRPSVRITSVSGTTIPGPIYSTDNVMKITYFVINASIIRGFKLKYTSEEATICEGSLDDVSGMIENPKNISALFCTYERTDRPFFSDTNRGTISFRLQDTQLTTAYSNFVRCSPYQSRVRVTRPVAGMAIELARYCGNITDITISSPFTTTSLEMSVFDANDRYKVYYELDRCGEIFTSPFRISAADLPNKLGSLNCAWFYKSDVESDLSINYNGTFTGSCAEEYITIFNGPSIDSPQLARICGEKAAATLHSRSSTLFIQYHANIYNNRSMFSVGVSSVLNACGGIVHKSIARIQTPGNGSYENNMDCTWELTANVGFTVNMSFVDRFFLEDSVNCTKDSVEIFDYVSDSWRSLGKFCGRQPPGRLMSSESRMKVRFITDARVVAEGFSIQWEEKCGGIYMVGEEARTLISPGYPSRYLPNLSCNYTLIAPKDKYIQVKFTDFQMEMRKNCDFDNVTVHANYEYIESDDLPVRETFCSSTIPPMQRYKNRMWIIMNTDRFVQKKGFEFTYKLDSCGGTITESTTIHSNEDSPTYTTQTICSWNITAPTDMEILIRFNYLELGHTQGCYIDFVDIFTGTGPDATRLIHLCGNHTTVPPIKLHHSDGSILFSSGYEALRGFSAEILFTRRCDRRINLTTSTPTYELSETGSTYVNNMDCHYVILAPEDYTLQLDFMNFHMQECESNGTKIGLCDYMEVRDGRGPFSELLGTYTGHNLPPALTSTRDGLYVRVVTGSRPISTGFTSRISIVPNNCGEHTYTIDDSTESVTLSYPRNGGNYGNNINCLWTFIQPGSEYFTLHLQFDRLDIENGTDGNCNTDYLEVYDITHRNVIYEGLGQDVVFAGTEPTHVQIGFWDARNVRTKHVYCGSSIPPLFISKSNQVFVRFKSNSDITRKGFSITASKASGEREWLKVAL